MRTILPCCCSLRPDTVNKYDARYAICKLNWPWMLSSLKKKTGHLAQRSTERDRACLPIAILILNFYSLFFQEFLFVVNALKDKSARKTD